MCGRFDLNDHPAVRDLLGKLGVELAPEGYERRYNVAPTAQVPVAFDNEGPAVGVFQWGITPRWSRPEKPAPLLINARCETIREKPSFRKSIANRRCVIPINGFYEWKREKAGKTPYYLRAPDGSGLPLAGIWDISRDGVQQCCIVTTAANEMMAPIHDRMPVILDPGAMKDWIGGGSMADMIDSMMGPASDDRLEATPVSTYVNNSRHDGPRCIEPV